MCVPFFAAEHHFQVLHRALIYDLAHQRVALRGIRVNFAEIQFL